MTIKTCENGHTFEKTSSCPFCPTCSAREMNEKYSSEFPRISAPAFRALDNSGIIKLKDLTYYTEKELLILHGMGPKAIEILRKSLEEKGWKFKK